MGKRKAGSEARPIGVPSIADFVEQAIGRLEQVQLGLAAYDGFEEIDDGAAGAVVFRLMQAREQIDVAIDRLL